MAKPWEKYQATPAESAGPWSKYQSAPADAGATSPIDQPEVEQKPMQGGGRSARVLRDQAQGVDSAAPSIPAPAPTSGQSARGSKMQTQNAEQLQGFRDQSAQSGIPLARDLEEIGAAPEMNEATMKALKASAGASFTFEDKEVGNILRKQLGAEIKQDAEGNFIALMPSGKPYAINKPGLSGQDAAKFLTAAAAFTPAGAARTIPGMVLGGMATQGAIEGGQAAIGGEVNPGEIAMAGAAPLAVAAGSTAIKPLLSKARSPVVNEYLEEQLRGGAKAAAGMADDAAKVGQTATMESMAPRFREGAKRADIRRAINEGTIEAAGYRLDPKGKVVTDKLQRELINKGVSDKVVVAANTMTKGNKAASLEMLDLAEDFARGVKGSEVRRPNMVIGKNTMKRFDVIKKAQEGASKRIGDAVENDLKGKPADISEAMDEFMESLEGLGISTEGGRLNFKESLVRGSNTTPIRNIYEMVKTNYDSAAELHRVKQAITNQINYESPVGKPIDREAEAALKALRSKINDKLRSMSKNYAVANDDYKKTAEVLSPFVKSMGRKFDPESSRLDNAVGQELRKTITNYAKSNELIEGLDALDSLARELGGTFDDDIMTQVMLNSELEKMLGSFAPGSMQGVIEKGTGAVMDRIIGSTAGGVARAGLNEAKNRVMFTPPSKEKLEAIKQLRELLSR